MSGNPPVCNALHTPIAGDIDCRDWEADEKINRGVFNSQPFGYNQTNRACVGFELSPEYYEVICRRFESLTCINAELVGSLTND